jgi:hypothetical protein
MTAKKRDNLIKVCLTNCGEDPETPWAEDLGPAPGPPGSRHVRLANVPFLHAKPTWGDVIVVSPVDDGLLTWDREGVAWEKLGTRIAEDGGRYAMIVDYTPPRGDASGDATYGAVAKASAKLDIICEGAYGPERKRAGRAYLAVPRELKPAAVMEGLHGDVTAGALEQIHPTPPKKKPKKIAAKRKRATGARRGR